jgi:hypothetical protein
MEDEDQGNSTAEREGMCIIKATNVSMDMWGLIHESGTQAAKPFGVSALIVLAAVQASRTSKIITYNHQESTALGCVEILSRVNPVHSLLVHFPFDGFPELS